MKYPAEQVKESAEHLRNIVKPGDTILTILRHVSRSGMMRHISLKVMKDGELLDITWSASRVLGDAITDDHAIKVGGCGMDMGFHLVYNLSRRLFAEGFKCIGRDNRCPGNDHANEFYDKKNGVAPRKKGSLHSDPGYALRQRWI